MSVSTCVHQARAVIRGDTSTGCAPHKLLLLLLLLLHDACMDVPIRFASVSSRTQCSAMFVSRGSSGFGQESKA